MIRNLRLSVTEHLSLFYEQHDDGNGTLYDIHADKLFDSIKDLQDDDEDGGYDDSIVSSSAICGTESITSRRRSHQVKPVTASCWKRMLR
ncbi:hypothetical protein PPTG_21622 [Phytophthora nicotianae INRA-310]|uniref:Uncharacterized protein n=1 Tax=Phytophthora nicotianae (strain INRA-310) TaxID=761204 RepID=W2QXU6_PHYN3|nr:hypothetical protein PPTG_21622 [Phytophthora nicotianae INRA-310]ETN17100.1 hypothetical protein PPTG_21622 [Phytophthora nicotianae INRA-310]